jgi:kynurenine formamidase
MPVPESRFIDLSHDVEAGMTTYQGLPAPLVCDFLSREASRSHYAEGTEFLIGQIELVGNTGTYLDSPFHRFAGGTDLAGLPLASLADLETVVIDVTGGGRAIHAEVFPDAAGLRGKAVLVQTGWDRYWRTDAYFAGHPFLTADAADYLVSAGAALVGIDSYNIDDTDDGRRPVHTSLLGADIPIVEHMTNLGAVPANGARFFAVPVKIRRFASFPVRAFVVVGGD